MSETVESQDVQLEVADGVGRITLNRPGALNAWTANLGRELLAALEQAAPDEAVRVVAISGAGRAFSSGADLSEAPDMTGDGKPDLRARLVETYNPVILAIREMPKPVVGVVNGPAVGIGCSLALACDLVIASESAYFLLAFANIGLTLDGGASAFLAARIGHARSAELALLAERLPAPVALEWGLINRVVVDERLEAEAADLIAALARGATRSYAASKRLLNARLYAGLAEQLELEADLQQEMAGTTDFVEGVVAFMQKRDAEFKGH
jgi:2-(1,2-epoxy-1,2-dihydrophenyl)acetyl-CoA isomerase